MVLKSKMIDFLQLMTFHDIGNVMKRIMMYAVDQQRDILLAVADQIGVEINLPSRVKIE